MAKWAAKDGFSVVSHEIFHARKQICEICPHWNSNAFAGLGGCNLCGCSVGKLYLPSCQCPDRPPRWLSVSASSSK